MGQALLLVWTHHMVQTHSQVYKICLSSKEKNACGIMICSLKYAVCISEYSYKAIINNCFLCVCVCVCVCVCSPRVRGYVSIQPLHIFGTH